MVITWNIWNYFLMRIFLYSVAYLTILLIFTFSLIPGQNSPPPFPHFDKYVHTLSYFFVTFWWSQLVVKKKHFILVLSFTAMGIFIEFLQGLTGYRSFDFCDMLANFLGTLIAFILALKHHQIFKKYL